MPPAERLTVLPLIVAGLALGLAACSSGPEPRHPEEMGAAREELRLIAAVKEATILSIGQATARLGREGAYQEDPALRIPVPDEVRDNLDALRAAGLAEQVDGLERAANRAAEAAAAEGEAVLAPAASGMYVHDAARLIEGHDTAITQYFRQRAGRHLQAAYEPLIRRHLEADPEYQDWRRQVIETRKGQAFLQGVEIEPVAYITDKALDGIFAAIGEAERAIRTQPEMRTTETLREAFGGP
jgi:hypothetical protein